MFLSLNPKININVSFFKIERSQIDIIVINFKITLITDYNKRTFLSLNAINFK